MKHTQGEWRVLVTDQTNVFEINARRPNERESICVVNSETDEEARANSKLIAAAPELLKACLMLLEEYKDVEMNTPIAYFKVIDAAKEAIKKATE